MGLRFNIDIGLQSKGSSQVASDMQRVAGQASKADQSVGRINASLMRMAKFAAGAFSVHEISRFVASSVKAASDVQEMQSLLSVTFGKAADDVREWAAVTSDAVGRSRFELLRFAGDFASFMKPLGTAPAQIAPMSQALAQLTVDLASFRNLAEEDVLVKLMSGLAGETEAVRRLGVDLSAAAVEQELLRMGIQKTNAAATQAEKVMARYAIIMRQTSDAQGDAVRTSDGLANMQRRLQGILFDVRVAIGEKLLPKITEMAKEFAAFAQTQEFEATVLDIAEALRTLADVVGALVQGLRELNEVGQPLADLFNRIGGGAPDPERLERLARVLELLGSDASSIRDFAETVKDDEFQAALNNVVPPDLPKRAAETAEALTGSGGLVPGLQQSGEAASTAAAAAKKYQDRLDDLRRTIDPIGSKTKEIREQQEFLDAALRRGDITVREWVLGMQHFGKELDELNPKLDILSKHLDSLPKAVPLPSEGVKEMGEEVGVIIERQEEAKRKQEEWRQAVFDTIGDWRDLAGAVADAFEGIDSGFAKAIAGTARFIESLLQVIQQLQNVQSTAQGIAFGISAGTSLGTQAGGLFGGEGKKISQFGAVSGGDYTQEGAAIGAVIGTVIGGILTSWSGGWGAAIGGVLGGIAGGIIGSFIKRGADQARATLQLVGQEIVADIHESEGGLGNVIEGMASSISRSVENILSIFDASLDAIPRVDIKVRGDKIVTRINGYKKVFEEMDEALAHVTAQIIALGDISGGSDVAFTQVLQAGHFDDLEGLEEAVSTIDQLIVLEKQYVKGLSEQEIALQSLPGHIEQLSRRLEDLGLSADQVTRLAGASLVAQMQQLKESITGVGPSVEQRRAQQRAAAELFNAELMLRIAELEAKRQALLAEQGLTAGEVDLMLARIEAGRAFVKSQGDLFNSQIEIEKGFLQASAAIVGAGAETLKKQIDAISKVIDALKNIGLIDIGSLRLPGAPRIPRGRGGRGRIGGGGPSLEDQLRGLLDSLFPAEAEARRFQEQLQLLEKAFEKGLINAERYAEAVKLVREQMAQGIRDALEQLKEFRLELTGGQHAPIGNQLLVAQREAQRAFNEARAGGGDPTKVADFLEANRHLLDLLRNAFGSGAGFQAGLREILARTGTLEDLFGDQLEDLLADPTEETAEHTAQIVHFQTRIEEHTRRTADDTRRTAERTERLERETRAASANNQVGHGKTRSTIAEFDRREGERFDRLERVIDRALRQRA